MQDDILEKLRSAVQSAEKMATTMHRGTSPALDADAETRKQLQRFQYFRTHVFSNIRGFLQTVLALQEERIRGAKMENVVTIDFPLMVPPVTRYGFSIPLHKPSSPRVRVEQALLTASVPGKNTRLYLISFQARSSESQLRVEFASYDELARKLARDFQPLDAPLDSESEFKEGEFLATIQQLVGTAIRVCIEDAL